MVQVGLYNTELAASLDMAVSWTLRHRAARPGIATGDMFLCNDPWVGGGLHQNDVSLFAPAVHRRRTVRLDRRGGPPGRPRRRLAGQLVGRRHRRVLGVGADAAGQDRRERRDQGRHRGHLPAPFARARSWSRSTCGPRSVPTTSPTSGCAPCVLKYGADTVKAVMRRVLNDAESRLRAKLSELPDGTWTSVAHQDSARSGDRGIYKIVCTLTKTGDHADVRLHRDRPAGRRFDQLHLRRTARGHNAGAIDHAVRRHPLGTGRSVAMRGDHQRAGDDQQLHLPVGDR